MRNRSDFILNALREDESTTRIERLYERIRQMILTGVIPPGYMFPNETEMCRQLQVGRGTIREVYQALLADGLISRSKAGTVINQPEEMIRRGSFMVATHFATFQDIFEFRLMLETEIVRTVAVRAKDEELHEIAAMVNEMMRHPVVLSQQQENDLNFHHTLVNYSHDPLLINMFSKVWVAFETMLVENHRVLRQSSPETIERSLDQHCAICTALLNRDQESACKAMRDHLQDVSAQTLLKSRNISHPVI